jgi:hypothetical protein
MGMTETLIVLGLAGFTALACNILDRRPQEPGKPRLIPYLALQYVALLVVVLMLGHLISLWTGKPFAGRQGGF